VKWTEEQKLRAFIAQKVDFEKGAVQQALDAIKQGQLGQESLSFRFRTKETIYKSTVPVVYSKEVSATIEISSTDFGPTEPYVRK